jgi:hypothetical protein
MIGSNILPYSKHAVDLSSVQRSERESILRAQAVCDLGEDRLERTADAIKELTPGHQLDQLHASTYNTVLNIYQTKSHRLLPPLASCKLSSLPACQRSPGRSPGHERINSRGSGISATTSLRLSLMP